MSEKIEVEVTIKENALLELIAIQVQELLDRNNKTISTPNGVCMRASLVALTLLLAGRAFIVDCP